MPTLTQADVPISKYQQNNHALPAFDRLLESLSPEERPESVIELGTASGLFSLALLKLLRHHIPTLDSFYTFDNAVRKMEFETRLAIEEHGGSVKTGDILKDLEGFISDLIESSGRVWLLCDNGDKIREFNMFAEWLKPGDFIFTHDYAPTEEVFEKEIRGKYWNCLEITDGPIQYSIEAYNLTPIKDSHFQKAAWGAFRKKA